MNAGLALGYFKAIRRVEGSSWEVVGRKGLNPEQHGSVEGLSVFLRGAQRLLRECG